MHGLLQLEDDVRLDDDIGDWFELCVSSGRMVFGYQSDPNVYPERVRNQVIQAGRFHLARRRPPNPPPIDAGLYVMERAHTMWGAQCVYLPRSILERLWAFEPLHEPSEDGQPIDEVYRQFIHHLPARERPLVAVPNFAAHMPVTSVYKPERGIHESFTYGLRGAPSAAEMLDEPNAYAPRR